MTTEAPSRRARVIGYVNRTRPACDDEGCSRTANTLHILMSPEGSEALAACSRHDWGGYWFDLYGPRGLLGGHALGWYAHLSDKRVEYRRSVADWLGRYDLDALWSHLCTRQAKKDPENWAARRWLGRGFVGWLLADRES